MASFEQLRSEDPGLADLILRAFRARKHATMATLCADGAPRISGTEVEFRDGYLVIGTLPGARKALDLLRDPRVAIHSPTQDPLPDGSWEGEGKVSGFALPQQHPDHLSFHIDLTSAVFTDLTDEQPPRLRIRLWRPGRGTATMYSG